MRRGEQQYAEQPASGSTACTVVEQETKEGGSGCPWDAPNKKSSRVARSASRFRSSVLPGGRVLTERLTEAERSCGLCAINLMSGHIAALLRFETAVGEVLAVTLLPAWRRPDLINDEDTLREGLR